MNITYYIPACLLAACTLHPNVVKFDTYDYSKAVVTLDRNGNSSTQGEEGWILKKQDSTLNMIPVKTTFNKTVKVFDAVLIKKGGVRVPLAVKKLTENGRDVGLAILIRQKIDDGDSVHWKLSGAVSNAGAGKASFELQAHDHVRTTLGEFRLPSDQAITIQNEGLTLLSDTVEAGVRVLKFERINPEASSPGEEKLKHLSGSAVVSLSGYESWNEVAQQLHAGFVEKEVITPKISALALDLTKGMTSDQEKSKILYRWVQTKIRYRDDYPGLQAYTPRAAEDVLLSGYGDCKDKVALFNTLLAAVGIRSTEVFLKVSNRWLSAPKIPGRNFNHVISYLPNQDVYLDSVSSEEFGNLPIDDQGHMVLRLEADVGGLTLIPASPPEKRVVTHEADIQVAADASASVHTKTTVGQDFYLPYYLMPRYLPANKAAVVKTIKDNIGTAWRDDLEFAEEGPRHGSYSISYTIRNFDEALHKHATVFHANGYPFTIADVVKGYLDSKDQKTFQCSPVLLTEITHLRFARKDTTFTLPAEHDIKDSLFEYSQRARREPDSNAYMITRTLRWKPSLTGTCEKPDSAVLEKLESVRNSIEESI